MIVLKLLYYSDNVSKLKMRNVKNGYISINLNTLSYIQTICSLLLTGLRQSSNNE